MNQDSKCANCKHLSRFWTKGKYETEENARCAAFGLKWGPGKWPPLVTSCEQFKAKNLTREIAGGIYGLWQKLGAKS